MKFPHSIGIAAILAALVLQTGCHIPGRLVGTAAALLPAALAALPIKLLFACIPEGTLVDTPEGPVPIESIRPGDEVVGFDGGTVRVLQVHAYAEDPEPERFHRITFENGAIVTLCDMHRIDGIRAKNVEPGDRVGGQTVLSNKIFGGVERSYDLLTEDCGYRIGGLPVNSMIEEMQQAARDGIESIED